MKVNCLKCDIILGKGQVKFCSNRCQFDYQYQINVFLWKSGKRSGSIGVNVRTTAAFIRRYLLEKFKYTCSICGWSKKNPTTGKVPLEIDHIDGNSENNSEANLRLICPNCHALTPNFKNLNKGKGRKWRMDKYIKVS